MKNIYDSWSEYKNKMINQFNLAGDKKDSMLSDQSAWMSADYPSGEDWKYVKFGNLPKTRLGFFTGSSTNKQVADDRFHHIEIENFSPNASLDTLSLPSGLRVESLFEHITKKPQSRVASVYKDEDRGGLFAQSALSFAGSGLVLRIDESVKIDRPIKLSIHLKSKQGIQPLSVFNVFVDCHESSESQIFVDVLGRDFSGLANLRFDFNLATKSRCELYSKESGGTGSYIVSSAFASVGQGASFNSLDFTLPSQWSRHNLTVDLKEQEASCTLRGGYLNNKTNFCDHHTEMNHWVGNTESNEDYRGILADEAKAVFNGKVFIEKDAAGSNSNQINKNLMLSQHAEVSTKPELQIYNDDVKAAHGATVGQIDEEQRFYLQSRGYSKNEAFHVLATAFVYDLIDQESDLVKDFYENDIKENVKVLEGSQ